MEILQVFQRSVNWCFGGFKFVCVKVQLNCMETKVWEFLRVTGIEIKFMLVGKFRVGLCFKVLLDSKGEFQQDSDGNEGFILRVNLEYLYISLFCFFLFRQIILKVVIYY